MKKPRQYRGHQLKQRDSRCLLGYHLTLFAQ
jgi:hypothetical protein